MYRLDKLATLAKELGFTITRPTEHRVDVELAPGVSLIFENLVDEDDTIVCFERTPWHSHGILTFLSDDGTYLECDELELLVALSTGDLLVVSSLRDGALTDRWLSHKDERLETEDLEPGEELRALRVRGRK